MIKMVDLILNVTSAASAFFAAVFWFKSAAIKMPAPDTTWGGFVEVPGAIIAAVNSSAKWNRIAALFAGVSALSFAFEVAWRLL
jgi:hypothetical protein